MLFRSNIENALAFEQNEIIYIKKWMKVDKNMIFRLSNKLVQVSFEDSISVIFDGEKREILYENRKGEVISCPLSEVLKAKDKEMILHFKTAKELLNKMSESTRNIGRSIFLLNNRYHSI